MPYYHYQLTLFGKMDELEAVEGFSNEAIVAAYFIPGSTPLKAKCKQCLNEYVKGNGFTNLSNHVKNSHKKYKDKMAAQQVLEFAESNTSILGHVIINDRYQITN